MGVERVKRKIRGVASVLERKGFDAGYEKKVLQANARIRKIFDEAKTELSASNFKQVYIAAGKSIKSSELYDALNPIKLSRAKFSNDVDVESLEKEILWASEKVAFFSDKVSLYIKYKKIIDRNVVNGNYIAAEKYINKLERELGESVWSAKKRIQVASHIDGIKGQKSVSEKLRREAGRGPVSFLLHQESIRIEDNTRASKYEADNQRRLKEFGKLEFMKNFLLYWVSCEYSNASPALAEILALSGRLSIMDYYDALVDVVKNCAAHKIKCNESIGVCIKKSVEILKGVNDERLLFIMSVESPEAIDELYDSVRHFQNHLIKSCLDEKDNKGSHIKKYGFDCLRDFVFRNDPVEAYDNLKKVCLSFPGHLYSEWILNLAYQDINRNYFSVSTKSPDFAINYGCLEFDLVKYPPDEYKSLLLGAFLNQFSMSNKYKWILDGINDERTEVDAALGDKSFREIFISSFMSKHPIIRSWIFDKVISKRGKGEITLLFGLLAKERVGGNTLHEILSIVDLYSESEWREFSGAEDLIDKAIFFDFMHNRTGEPKNETNKRFALEEIVENYGAESFDSFLNKINVDDERTRVVLKNICVPSIIDMLDIIHDSKRVYYIRRDVCNFVIDKYGFDESIKSEIESIDAIIRLNEISEFVDSNKIFVDADGMASWNKRNLKQDFERFLTLVDPTKESVISLESLLLGKIYDPLLYSSTDIDESDIQLYDMLEKMKKQFLFDPSFGLDGYLSKRVRHNTLHIFLRSSFDDARFVTLKDCEQGGYKESEYWNDKLSYIDDEDRASIIEALKKFSESFDNEVLRVVDDFLHVKSEDKPKGMLDIPLTDTYLLALKSSAIESRSLATLSSHVISTFWTLLKPSLDDVKKLLVVTFRKRIDGIFDALRGTVKKVADKYCDDKCFIDLGMEITKSHNSLIDNIEKSSCWFSQSRAESITVPCNVKEIFSSVIDYVNKQHSGRDPVCRLDCPNGIEMQFKNVLLISDVVKDLLENVFVHCGIERGVEIDISVRVGAETRFLNIESVNSLSMSALSRAKGIDREKIKQKMFSGEWKKFVRKEGETGLYKIWSSSAASGDAKIDFGVSELEKFFVKLDLPVAGGITLS